MRITAVCPQCQNGFQVEESLRGQKIRCPIPSCRSIFVVGEGEPKSAAATPAAGKTASAGSVGSLIPIVPAEIAPAPMTSTSPPRQAAPSPVEKTGRTLPSTDEDWHLPLTDGGTAVPLIQAEALPPADRTESGGQQSGHWSNAPPVRGHAAPATPPAPPKKPVPLKRQPPQSPTQTEPATGAEYADWRAAAPPSPAEAPPSRPPSAPANRAPAAPTGPATGVEFADWRAAAPPSPAESPTRPPSAPTLPSQPAAAAEPPAQSGPVEMPPGTWEPPPVRKPSPESATSTVGELEAAALKKQRARRFMIAIVVGLVVLLGAGGGLAWYLLRETEDRLRDKVEALFADGSFDEAGEGYRKLAKKYGESGRKDEYDFMARLSDLFGALNRDSVADAPNSVRKIADFADEFSGTEQQRERLLKYGNRLGEAAASRAVKFLEAAKDKSDVELGEAWDVIQKELQRVEAKLPGSVDAAAKQQMAKLSGELRERIRIALERKRVLDALRAMVANANAQTIREAREYIRRESQRVQNLLGAADVEVIINDMYESHRKRIRYVAAGKGPLPAPAAAAADQEPGIILDPVVAGRQLNNGNDRILALCRGMLYTLDASSGETDWSIRVGVDATRLPIRLPATPNRPERLMILSADMPTLTALDPLTGRTAWQVPLSAKCVGRPVILNDRAYLPTFDGRVHEVELAEGTLLGWYELGQPVSVGGAHQAGTNLIYFAADDSCVYALDVARKDCSAILYTYHRNGSLRGEPIVVGENDQAPAGTPNGYLLLSLATGLQETSLRLYSLPITAREAKPVDVKTEPKLAGWTWFAPYRDSEKVVCLSDRARLGLFGIKQPGNADSALFPLVPSKNGSADGFDLSKLLDKQPDEQWARSLVAHVVGDEFWLLALGQLQRVSVRLDRVVGPKPVALWHRPLFLGSPLHEPQILEKQGKTTLYLVTQPHHRPVTLITAIDPEAKFNAGMPNDPRLLWQRQLGVIPQAAPIRLGDRVILLDQGGRIYHFNSKEFSSGKTERGEDPVGDEVDYNAASPGRFLVADANTAYALFSNRDGSRLIVRRCTVQGGGKPALNAQEINLGNQLTGNVILLGDSLLVPVSSGPTSSLLRYSLPLAGNAPPTPGPTWRSRRASPDAHCFLTAVSDDAFLSSDGGRGLTLWKWPANGLYSPVLPPDRGDTPTVELPSRPVAAPVVLPRAAMNDPLRALVADAQGKLTLLEGDLLKTIRTWDLGGLVTAGPFLRGGRVGCIIERTRLVWIDPNKPEKLWAYPPTPDANAPGIVGEPHLVEGMLIVCDELGRYVGLNPETGRPRGEPYTLKAAVAPAASAVPFGPGRAFAPLTDGTILLLSLDRLRPPWWRWERYFP